MSPYTAEQRVAIARVIDLITEAAAFVEQSDGALNQALELRRRALAAMPDGARLRWWAEGGDVIVRRDGNWYLPDGSLVNDVVQDYWERGSLMLAEEES